MALIDRVLTDPTAAEALGALDERLRGGPVDWARMVHDNKRAVADGILRSEVLRIGRELRVAIPADAPADTEDAVGELVACFPVYRSYLPGGREHLDEAFALAREHRPDLAATLDVLLPVLVGPAQPPALRFQQTSGMVMAKGVEDCSFYRWSRLTSLNEVGADPSVFSVTADEWHDAMATRQRDWPHAMTALSTHDTKRGEDVRARITALAEVPDTWERALDRLLDLVPLPDPGFGNLLWQAIVGAWPARGLDGDWRERLHGYAEKAMREAGDRTHVDRARRGLRGRGARRRRRRDRPARGARRGRRGARRRRRRRLEQRPGRQARRDHDAGRARRLPGQRAVGAVPRRPRQPSPGRLRRTHARCCTRSSTACARR